MRSTPLNSVKRRLRRQIANARHQHKHDQLAIQILSVVQLRSSLQTIKSLDPVDMPYFVPTCSGPSADVAAVGETFREHFSYLLAHDLSDLPSPCTFSSAHLGDHLPLVYWRRGLERMKRGEKTCSSSGLFSEILAQVPERFRDAYSKASPFCSGGPQTLLVESAASQNTGHSRTRRFCPRNQAQPNQENSAP